MVRWYYESINKTIAEISEEIMKNWSNTTEKFEKNSDQYIIWRLEQLINFGLDGEKISSSVLKKYFSRLEIDLSKKRYLKFLLKSL